MEFISQEAVVTADLQTAHSLPASLPQAFSAPSPCVLIFSYSVVTTQLPVSYSVATTQLPVSAPAHPHQTHSPLCPFPISQTQASRLFSFLYLKYITLSPKENFSFLQLYQSTLLYFTPHSSYIPVLVARKHIFHTTPIFFLNFQCNLIPRDRKFQVWILYMALLDSECAIVYLFLYLISRRWHLLHKIRVLILFSFLFGLFIKKTHHPYGEAI